jgi:hypothetical protein
VALQSEGLPLSPVNGGVQAKARDTPGMDERQASAGCLIATAWLPHPGRSRSAGLSTPLQCEASMSLVARDAPKEEEPALSRNRPCLRNQKRVALAAVGFPRGSDRIRIGYSRRVGSPIAAEKSANTGYRGRGSRASATSFYTGISSC